MKRITLGIALGLLCLISCVDSVSAQIATTSPATSTPGEPGFLIADLNMENTQVVSHSDRTYRIRFDLVNKVPAVSGVRYGVVLVAANAAFADQRVYEEALDIPENVTLTRTIDYTIPDNLEGRFSLVVKAKNSLGIPLASGTAGEVDARRVATGGELAITPAGCTPVNLELICDVSSTFPSTVSVTPVMELYKGSLYGEKLAVSGIATSVPVVSTSHQKISVPLPQPSEPGRYAVRFFLESGESRSNAVSLSFSVAGKSGMLDFFSLDKGSYEQGETIVATILWSSNPARGLNEAILAPQARIIVSSGDRECAHTDIPLRQNMTLSTSSFSSLIDCPKASATVTLLDGSDALTESEYMKNPSSNGPSLLVIALSVLLVALAGAGGYWLKRRGSARAMGVLLVLCAVGVGLFGFAGQSDAATFVYYTQGEFSEGYDSTQDESVYCDSYYCTRYVANVNLDKSTYRNGFDSMKVTVDWLAYDDNYRTMTVAAGVAGTVETIVNHHQEVAYYYLMPSDAYFHQGCGGWIGCSSYGGPIGQMHAPYYQTHGSFQEEVQGHSSPNYFDNDAQTYVDPVLAHAKVIPANAWTISSSDSSEQIGSGSNYTIFHDAVTELSMNNYPVLAPIEAIDSEWTGTYYMPIYLIDQWDMTTTAIAPGEASTYSDRSITPFTVYMPFTLTVPDTRVEIASISCDAVSGRVYDSSNSAQNYSVSFLPGGLSPSWYFGASPWDGPPEDTYAYGDQYAPYRAQQGSILKPLTNGNALYGLRLITLTAGDRGSGAFTIDLDNVQSVDGNLSLDYTSVGAESRPASIRVAPLHNFRSVYHSYSYVPNSVNYYSDYDGSYEATVDYGKIFASSVSFNTGKSSWSDFTSAASAATFLNDFTAMLGHTLYASTTFGHAYWNIYGVGNSSELVSGFPESPHDRYNVWIGERGILSYDIAVPSCDSIEPAVSIVAAPENINHGDPINLSWASQNTDFCIASDRVHDNNALDSGTWHGERPVSGTESVESEDFAFFDEDGNDFDQITFTMACTGTEGTATSSITVSVRDLPDIPRANLFVSPEIVSFEGETVNISASGSNATSCTAEDTLGLWSGDIDPEGADDEVLLGGTAAEDTFTLSCEGPLGFDATSITVFVDQCPFLDGEDDSAVAQSEIPEGGEREGDNCISPLAVTLDAFPTSLPYTGGSVSLSWSARGAIFCSASDTLGLWSDSKSPTVLNEEFITLGNLSDTFDIFCTDGIDVVNAGAFVIVDQCAAINGQDDPTVQESIPSGMSRNDVTGDCLSDSFTLGPDEDLRVAFPNDAAAISDRKVLEVSPLGYASAVSVSVISGPTLPGTTTIEYSFDNGATFSSGATGVISPSSSIFFKARVSKKVINDTATQYPIVIQGVNVNNPSISATKTLYLNGRSSQQIFEEL